MSAASSQKLFPEGGSGPVARESRRLGEDRYQFIVQASRDSVALLAMGHVPPSSFGNSAAAASLTVQILKITEEKHVLQFRHLARTRAVKNCQKTLLCKR